MVGEFEEWGGLAYTHDLDLKVLTFENCRLIKKLKDLKFNIMFNKS